jgi:hypothetical protein
MVIDILTLIVLTGTGVYVAVQALETRRTAQAAKMSAESMKLAERAYVGIQCRQKGDTGWTEDFSFHACKHGRTIAEVGPNCHRLHIRITNTGPTPALIRGGGIQCWPNLHERPFEPPVSTPDGRGKIDGNFLHAGAHYSVKLTYDLNKDEIAAMGRKELWLIGYLEYSDTFRTIHRAGFCRRVGTVRDRAENNLFVDEHCGPYNYDCELDEHGKCKQTPKPKPVTAQQPKGWWKRTIGRL